MQDHLLVVGGDRNVSRDLLRYAARKLKKDSRVALLGLAFPSFTIRTSMDIEDVRQILPPGLTVAKSFRGRVARSKQEPSPSLKQ